MQIPHFGIYPEQTTLIRVPVETHGEVAGITVLSEDLRARCVGLQRARYQHAPKLQRKPVIEQPALEVQVDLAQLEIIALVNITFASKGIDVAVIKGLLVEIAYMGPGAEVQIPPMGIHEFETLPTRLELPKAFPSGIVIHGWRRGQARIERVRSEFRWLWCGQRQRGQD